MAAPAYTRYNAVEMTAERADSELQPRLFVVDRGGEQAVTHTRLWAAGISATAGIWLFAQGGGMLMAAFALTAVVFSMIWTMGWLRQRIEHLAIDERYLQLNGDGFAVSDGRILTTVEWDEVTGVWVDEDRLAVCVGVRDAEPLSLDAPYEGATPHELAGIIHEFFEHAKACSERPDA